VNGLDLFSGIGGITLALQEWVTPVAYCEIDEYARNVLLSRMLEGKLPVAPIWDDVKSLKGDMLPEIDIIYGGFPCQDISVAGKQKGLEGERSGLFYEIMRLAQEVKPAFIFLENVPNIRTKGLDAVGGELAKRGYDCRWGIVSAQEMGALHKRERWFLLAKCNRAYDNGKRLEDARAEQQTTGDWGEVKVQPSDNGRTRVQGDCQKQIQRLENFSWCKNVQRLEDLRNRPDIPEPLLRGKGHGVLNRVDRVKCLGNAVVPIQAREAFMRLMKDIL